MSLTKLRRASEAFLILIVTISFVSCDLPSDKKKLKKWNRIYEGKEVLAKTVSPIVTDETNSISIIPTGGIELGANTSDFIDSVWYVPLETKTSGMIGRVRRFESFAGKYFILNDGDDYMVKIFDHSGMYLRDLTTLGKGPGEAARFVNFDIDTIHSRIIAGDNLLNRISYYNLKGGFVKSVNPNFRYTDFEYYNEEELLFWSSGLDNSHHSIVSQYLFFKFSSDEGITGYSFPKRKDTLGGRIGNLSSMRKSNESLLIHSIASDTVFAYQNGKIQPKYVVPLIGNDLNQIDGIEDMSWLSFRESYLINGLINCTMSKFMDTRSYFLFDAFYEGKYCTSLYNKKTNKVYTIDANTTRHDVSNFSGFFEFPIGQMGKDVIVTFVQPSDLKIFINPEVHTQSYIDWVNSIDEYQNGILAFIKLK